jgi:hypothetical protein
LSAVMTGFCRKFSANAISLTSTPRGYFSADHEAEPLCGHPCETGHWQSPYGASTVRVEGTECQWPGGPRNRCRGPWPWV